MPASNDRIEVPEAHAGLIGILRVKTIEESLSSLTIQKRGTEHHDEEEDDGNNEGDDGDHQWQEEDEQQERRQEQHVHTTTRRNILKNCLPQTSKVQVVEQENTSNSTSNEISNNISKT